MVILIATLPPPFHSAHANPMPPPTSTLPSRKRKLAPLASSPSVSDSSADQDGEYDPGPSSRLSGGGKRTRPPPPTTQQVQGAITKPAKGMSREALRKANHSLIERRRREKINHALGELRDMVPGLGEAGGGKGGEFKLEVLERTVIHMKHLKSQILDLESKIAGSSSISEISSSGSTSRRTLPKPDDPSAPAKTTTPARKRATPPSPSTSPDPNETDLESNLPPPLTLSSRPAIPTFPLDPAHSRPSSPSITSLLASIPDNRPPLPTSRPEASAQAYNPTLYLPFPTPSPTSPFLTYSHGGSTASSSGPPEPSPFLAPMQGMPLFGGALSLDHILAPSPKDAFGCTAVLDVDMRRGGMGGQGGEKEHEAANVLLAFSSPDVMRPSLGMTPIVQTNKGDKGERERRGTLDSEEFTLDGEATIVVEGVGRGADGTAGRERDVKGKTAREILRM